MSMSSSGRGRGWDNQREIQRPWAGGDSNIPLTVSPSGVVNNSQTTSSISSSSSSDTNSQTEGFDIELFFDPGQRFLCPICMMVLREPAQTQCGHRFCHACIHRWVRLETNPQCPVCKELCSKSQIFLDNYAKREIMSLAVKCPHHKAGCLEVIDLCNLEKHILKCLYAPVSCSDCHIIITRNRLRDHRESCSSRIVSCDHCKVKMRYPELKVHLAVCPEVKQECTFCAKNISKIKMADHVKTECSEAIIGCFYRDFGCDMKLKRSDHDRHMQDYVVHHVYLLTRHIKIITTKIEVNQSQSGLASALPAADPGFCSDYSGTSNVCSQSPIKQPIAHSCIPHDDVSNDYRRPSATEQQFPIYSGQLPYLRNHFSSQQLLRHNLNLGQEQPQTYPLEERAKSEREERENLISRLKEKVEKQEKILSEQSVIIRQLSDLEGRICNGVYIWKIKNYASHKLDAVEMKSVVVHSPGFYTSLYGYRMCIRVNLNGVEAGTGTHLSLFVHLMQGEYDEVNTWPFHGRITLSILDQCDTTDKHDITETLIAKPGLAAFLRPTTKRNHKGFGYIEFAPLSFVENGNFIKNDMMIVKAVVKPDE